MIRIALAILAFALAAPVNALNIGDPEVAVFIDEMVEQHDYDREKLEQYFAAAEIKQPIIDLISKPAEKSLSWGQYRNHFLTKERIEAGAKFWREHDELLTRISESSGVSKEILVGIIGVETYYGRITGKHRVIDALSTLAFAYPPRSKFFRKELREYLLLARDENMDATEATGSYAGAMGRPQFMPSSFRAYAVDSTGDGKIDIWNNWEDVAGSIANYFIVHGWRENEEVVARASLGGSWKGEKPKPRNTLKATETVDSLSKRGVVFATSQAADERGQLLAYEGADGPEYWVGFHNFFVITKYNRSVMYALAVHQLGQEVAAVVSEDAAS